MSAQIQEAGASAPVLSDLTIEDALDELDAVNEYIAKVQPAVNLAIAERAKLESIIECRMREMEATKFVGPRHRLRYENRKVGSASVPYARELRDELLRTNLLLDRDVDAALPLVAPPPIVKADLRKVRKLADYGAAVKAILSRHIVEARSVDVLVVEPIEKNVTGSARPVLES